MNKLIYQHLVNLRAALKTREKVYFHGNGQMFDNFEKSDFHKKYGVHGSYHDHVLIAYSQPSPCFIIGNKKFEIPTVSKNSQNFDNDVNICLEQLRTLFINAKMFEETQKSIPATEKKVNSFSYDDDLIENSKYESPKEIVENESITTKTIKKNK
jgi:hypothetical protein